MRDGSVPQLDKAQTPALVLEKAKLLSNIERLKRRVAGLDVTVRPHLKTAKCLEIALAALESRSGPATVSTLREAEEIAAVGINDLLYAVCISPQKLERVTSLRRSGVDLKVVVDSLESAGQVGAHASRTGDRIPVLIEIDADGHRSGLYPSQVSLLLEIGRTLERHSCLAGVMTHAGESYFLQDRDSLLEAAEQERTVAANTAAALRSAGLPCPIVSIGSTPTVLAGASLDGITEIRLGVYMFFDLVQCGIGVCSVEDVALSVMTTVIGHKPDKGWIIVDAGWMAMSLDRGTRGQRVDQYYGVVCDVHGTPFEDVVLLRIHQEHGIIAARPGSGAGVPDLAIGDRVRILPNHACATAAQHDDYLVVEGSRVVDVWKRFRGW